MAGFNLEQWKKSAQKLVQSYKQDFKHGVLISLSACAFLPLLIASKDPNLYFIASSQLFTILAGMGGNILAGEIQKWLSRKDLSVENLKELIQESIDQNKGIIDEIDYVIKELQLLEYTEKNLSEEDKLWFKDTLKKEFENNSHPVLTTIITDNLFVENYEANNVTQIIKNATFNKYYDTDFQAFINAYYKMLSKKTQYFPLGTIDEDFDNLQKGIEISTNDIYTNLDLSFFSYLGDELIVPVFDKSDRYGIPNYILNLANGFHSNSKEILSKKIFTEGRSKLKDIFDSNLYINAIDEIVETINDNKNTINENDLLKFNLIEKSIILGEAGSGKSTFLDNLSFLKINYPERLPENIQNHILLRIILRDAAKYLSVVDIKDNPEVIWKAIKEDFVNSIGKDGSEEAFITFKKLILENPCLVLFDGLDEIPDSEERRVPLINSINSFIQILHPESKIIITMRPYAFDASQWISGNFFIFYIKPFTLTKIREFIRAWYRTLKVKGLNWSLDLLENREEDLIKSISSSQKLMSLAERPLLLTIFATLHTNGGSLPEDRATLYEKATTLLLSRWQLRYAKNNAIEDELFDINLINLLSSNKNELRYCMNAIAFQAHENQYKFTSKEEIENSNETTQPGEILRKDILAIFDEFLPKEISPGVVIEYISNRTGLLIAKSNNIFAFPHRTFQEFLSACYILDQPNSTELLLSKLEENITWWREVYLLAVGRKKDNFNDSITLISSSLPIYNKDWEELSIYKWDIVLLATEAIIELQIMESPINSKKYSEMINYIRSLLIYIINNQIFESDDSDNIKMKYTGALLSYLGDTRKGIGIVIQNDNKIPDIEWVTIPPEEYSFFNKNRYTNLTRENILKTDLFTISRYPITNAQFKLFVLDGGLDSSKYWDNKHWQIYENIEYLSANSIENYIGMGRDSKLITLNGIKNSILSLPKQLLNCPVVIASPLIINAFFNWMTEKLGLSISLQLPNIYQLLAAASTGKIYSHRYQYRIYDLDSVSIGCLSSLSYEDTFSVEIVDFTSNDPLKDMFAYSVKYGDSLIRQNDIFYYLYESSLFSIPKSYFRPMFINPK